MGPGASGAKGGVLLKIVRGGIAARPLALEDELRLDVPFQLFQRKWLAQTRIARICQEALGLIVKRVSRKKNDPFRQIRPPFLQPPE